MSKVCGRCGNSGFKITPLMEKVIEDRSTFEHIEFQGISIECAKCQRRDVYTEEQLGDLIVNDCWPDDDGHGEPTTSVYPPTDGSLPG